MTAGKKGGTGLGLAIVKKIAEEHGGTVAVRSSDQGVTFDLRIPQGEGRPSLAAPKRPEAPATAKKERAKATPKKRKSHKAGLSKSQE